MAYFIITNFANGEGHYHHEDLLGLFENLFFFILKEAAVEQ